MPAGADCEIRTGRAEDAAAVSAVIEAALRQTSAADYSPAVIEHLVHTFRPDSVRALMARRLCFVAVVDGRIAGTASLEGNGVRSVFVTPAMHRRGIGRRLMAEVERAARERSLTVLVVRSSIGAEPFYAALGFVAVGEDRLGNGRIILMQRQLPGSARSP